MSGHSKWASIKHKKAATDAKKGKAFTRVANMISIAARDGGDPVMNPALAMAIEKAREVNMPKANVGRAIKKGTGELGGEIIEEVVYEGYGPESVAIIIEVATDNKNRTVAEVRSTLIKNGGSMASNGAVMFNFNRRGQIEIINSKQKKNIEEIEEAIIESGASDMEIEKEIMLIHTDPKDLMAVKGSLEENGLKIHSAELLYASINSIKINDKEKAEKIIRLIDVLGDLDDVVGVHANFELSDEIIKEIE